MTRGWIAAMLLALVSPAWAYEPSFYSGQHTAVGILKISSLGPDVDGCNLFLFNANAVFFRATTFCGHDYFDTAVGYVALAGAKKCQISKDTALLRVKAAMLSFDRLAQQHGIGLACTYANGLVRAIRERSP